MLVALRPAVRLGGGSPRERSIRQALPVRLHVGTDEIDGNLDLGRRASVSLDDGRTTAVLRLDRPVAVAFGDRFALRRPSPGETLAGGMVLDPRPPRGVSRRRVSGESLMNLAGAGLGAQAWLGALVALHGALPSSRADALVAAVAGPNDTIVREKRRTGSYLLDPSICESLDAVAIDAASAPDGVPLSHLRTDLVVALRRRARIDRTEAPAVVDAFIAALVAENRIVRNGDQVLLTGRPIGPSAEVQAAMARLEATLAVPSPPSLSEAARAAGCSAAEVRALEAAGRITRVEDDLAWATSTVLGFEELAVRLASPGPLAPAAFRDATGTSRRYALAILEDLDRRGILRRTPAGHVVGPRAGTLTTRT
jgi:selenocysteine-specific elongation factor